MTSLTQLQALAPHTLTLPDGRTLAWYEFGDPTGTPCLYTTGTPSSGVIAGLHDEAARAAGVRWISVDKPGYGHSSYDPNRSLLGYVEDVLVLLDQLGIERTAVAGESGGGPHVLALAYGMPQRCTVALVLAGMGPGHEAWVREGMKPANRRVFWLAKRAPWVLRPVMSLMGSQLCDPDKRATFAAKRMAAAPPADKALMTAHPEVMEVSLLGAAGAFRQGSRAATQEMALFVRPWGFALEDISVPVELWHGSEDMNVPIAVARHVAAKLPACTAHLYEGEGHGLALNYIDDIMAVVVKATGHVAG